MSETGLDPYGLSVGLERTAERFTSLLDEALQREDASPMWAREALAELATGMEELRVAEEELIVQAEQLSASRDAIDAERERYAELFESAPDGYVETDELGKIVEANAAATQLFGVPSRYLVGKLIHSFVTPDDRRTVRSRLTALLDSGAPQDLTVRIDPRHGAALWTDIRAASHYDPVAGTTRVRWLIRDITERVKLEQELSELHVSVDLLSALSEVNRLVEGEDDTLSSVLHRLVELAHRVTGADAGIMIAGHDGRIEVRATAGEAAADICGEQIDRGGPAVHTQLDGRARTLTVEELVEWPELARLAKRYSLRALICEPIHIDGAVRGTFNLYVRDLLGESTHVVHLLAQNAAATIANAQVYAGARTLASHLETALESRGVIEQAKGILMAMQRCTADEAFDILRRASQRENRKLRAVAEAIVDRFSRREPPP